MIEIRVSEGEQPATTDGPHWGDQTRAIAEAIGEAVRLLNYATMPEKSGLTYPSDVYSVLGALGAAMQRFPQAFDQMAAWIVQQAEDGYAAEAKNGPHRGNEEEAADHLSRLMHTAAETAEDLGNALRDAQAAASGLYYCGDDKAEE